MNLLYWVTSSFCLLLCLIVCSCGDITITGFYGQDVTLPCKYDSKYHGKCEICWLKGDIPASGCGAEILTTNGDEVNRRTSTRYTLKGDIQSGDVSLTIVNATKHDSGKYGCRVHVPGWFNDEKYVVILLLSEAPTPKPTTPVNSLLSSTTEISTEGPWLSIFTREANFTNTSLPVHNKNVIDSTYDMLPGIVVSVLLLLFLGPLAVYFMWKQKRKSRGTLDIAYNLHPSVVYGNLNSTVGILNRETAVENVYQLDTENEYERWS
ncbi:hepatitis A virus cellular receptor 1 [Colossoma macropomum]|uniref:hepatitis A virus cellular receptor 1 n=1 Tax=Colossoma macropomum TaxID=42526 RepID=UPI0018646136|nr:hepatitis A virus cellular receptor 1 [Colossoma macropomum]